MANKTNNQVKWVAGGAVFIDIGEHEVILVGGKEPGRTAVSYEGGLDFTSNPVSLVTIANRVFSKAFDIELPASKFDVLFNSIYGKITAAPDTKYQFKASSEVSLQNPFDLPIDTIDFKELDLEIKYQKQVAPPISALNVQASTKVVISKKFIKISATVINKSTATSVTYGNAILIFANGVSVFGLQITTEIDPAKIVSSILGITIPNEIRSFLPVFKPESGTKPIRLYKASSDYSYEKDGSGPIGTVSYKEGFQLDQLVINILGYDFLGRLSITKSKSKKTVFEIAVRTPKINLFNFIEIAGKDASTDLGPELVVISKDTSIKIHSKIKFLPTSETPIEVDLDLTYVNHTKTFGGNVRYHGDIAGQHHPELGFIWNKQNGFQLTKYPYDSSGLQKALDWAKELKKFSNSSKKACEKACGELVDLAFDQAITTSFDFHFKPAKSTTTGWVSLDVTGSYSIVVVGNSPIVIAMDTPVKLDFKIPSSLNDLSTAIASSLVANVDNIALSLWNNQSALLKLLTYVTLKTGGQIAVCKLSCKVGKKALKDGLQKPINKPIGNVGPTISLSKAAAIVVTATGVIGAVAKFVSWLFGLSSEDEKKRKAAENKRKEAIACIKNKLVITSLAGTYNEGIGTDKNITVTWSNCNDNKIPDSGNIKFHLEVSSSEGSQTRIINQTTETSYGYVITKPVLKNGVQYSIKVYAVYNGNGGPYQGTTKSIEVAAPVLTTPNPVLSFKWDIGSIEVNWSAVAPKDNVYISAYEVQLRNITTKETVTGKEVTIPGSKNHPPGHSTTIKLYQDPDKEFVPNPKDTYQIWVQAIASDRDLDSLQGKSSGFKIPWGIGYMGVEFNFKII